MEKLVPLLIVVAVVLSVAGGFVLAIRWARKSSRRGAFAAWGMQLFGAGMNPLPPPQEQIEEVARQTKIKKASESGDPED
ncbi:MAG TPA: hypothetical protein VGD54_10255 [Steroidobacteraceae bacterium]